MHYLQKIKLLLITSKSASTLKEIASIATVRKLNRLNDSTQNPKVKIEMRRMRRLLRRSELVSFKVWISKINEKYWANFQGD